MHKSQNSRNYFVVILLTVAEAMQSNLVNVRNIQLASACVAVDISGVSISPYKAEIWQEKELETAQRVTAQVSV